MSAMTDVAGYISSEVAGSVNSAQNDYVRFAQNDGPLLKANDQKKITQSFWLGANKFHYNHNFDIEWRWVPMKEAETGGGKSEDDWKNYLNNLFSIQDTNRLPSNSEYEKEGKKTAILDAIDEAAQALNQRTEENYYLSKYDIVDMDGSQAAREYAKMINVSQSITTGEDGKRGREATVSINKTEDTFGMMVATLTYELSADQMAEIKKEDGTQDNGETLIVYKSYAFPVVVEGEGKPGSVSLFSSRLGQEPNSSYTPDDGTSSQINQKGEPKFTLFSQDNQMMIQGETFQKSTQLNMSDFDGGMERDEGSRNPYNGLTDYEYVLQVNMGLYRSKAHHAVVTVSSNPDKNNQDEEKRVITVAERDGGERLPSGMGSVLADNNKTINQILSEGSRPQQDHHRWTATEDKNFNDSSLQRDTSQDTEENQDTDRYILMNNGNDDTVEYTAYLVLRARGSGVADVTVDFYDENNNLITDNLNKPASPYRLRATVQHKAPNINRTLGLVQLWAIGNGLERELELVQEPIGGGTAVTGYDPEVENYKQEVPFTYKHYQLRVPKGTINDNNTSQKVTVTVTNENGAEIPFYPVQENGQQVLKTEVKLSKDELNKGFDFYIWDNENDADKTTMDNGQGKNFNTKIGDLYSINFEVQADYKTLPTKTYHFKLRRTEASKNKNLTFLGVYYTQKDAEGDGKTRNNLLENFDPNGDKFFTKPFSYDYKTVYVLAEYDDNTYMEITYRPERETTTGREQQVVLDKLPKEAINGEVGTTLPCLKLYVDSEAEIEAAKKENKYPIEHTETLNPLDMPEYRIFFNRDEPSHNALLNSVKIYDAEALDRGEKKALPHSPTQFTADNLGPYYLTNRNAVPYSTSKLRLEITPADNRFSSIEIFVNGKPDVVITDKKEDEGKINGLIELKNKLTAQGEDGFGEEDVNIITIVVTPQDNLRPDPDAEDSGTPGENNQKTYEFRIARMPANTEPRLDPVKIMDQDDKEIRTDFHRDGTQQNGKEYELLLPYETWQISVEATPIDPNASIRLTVSPEKTGEQVTDLVKELLGDKKATLEPGKPSIKYPLNAPGNPRTFTVTGVAEDGKTVADYVFKIDREPPSTDALLKRLDVTNLTSKGLTPLFKARETEYTATLAEGQRAVTITAVPNEEHATIRIDGTLV